MTKLDHIVTRLASQFARGEPVLFTGAGFSVEAQCSTGQPIPSTKALTEELWKLAFPSEPVQPDTRLGDAFYSAYTRNRGKLAQLIKDQLSVDSNSLPEFYRRWFSMPWSGCYTLNVDDIELAAMRRYSLGHVLSSVSATSGRRECPNDDAIDLLEVVHLNGLVGDDIADLTFSAPDYGARQTSPDQWMLKAASDVITRPIVFVGTDLDEPTLWQYLEYRKVKGARGVRELRPGSVLVTPSLNPTRQILLDGLNIDWIGMTAQEFAEEVLAELESSIEEGRRALRAKRQSAKRTLYPQLVADLSIGESNKQSNYLLGQEPEWADLLSGRAIKRSCDPEVLATADDILSGNSSGRPLVLTGTAGSGKSTSLMRLALQLTATGIATYWIDERSNFEVHQLRDLVTRTDEPIAILVDDADIYGRLISGWARELPTLRPKVLFGCAIRATKVDGILDEESLGGTKPIEISMPQLEDHDIDDLIRVLDNENRLGILKGASPEARHNAFRREAGRQLLVGMFQATSGFRFSEKAVDEFAQLEGIPRILYGVISLVHAQRYSLSLEEVLTAVGSRDNETLNDLEHLVRRGIVTRDDRYSGYQTRHRVISEQVVASPHFRSVSKDIIEGLFVALASSVTPNEPRTSRVWRRFIRFTNHEFILSRLALDDGRQAYESIEGFMSWDYHFWLQRGSLELQEGDLGLATNYLSQALSLAPEDRFVRTGWSYLLMKKAAQLPEHVDAKAWFSRGSETLLSLIEDSGIRDPHPYHILGSQTIAWVHSARLTPLELRVLLGKAGKVVENGVLKNPRNRELRQLNDDIRREWLMTAVGSSKEIS